MRTLTLTLSHAQQAGVLHGPNVMVIPVEVDWFEPLTEFQIIANGEALANNDPIPHPNPNIIRVELVRV